MTGGRADSSKLTLQRVFETIDIPTIILDAAGDVVVWNEAEAELTGISREEVEGLDTIGEYFYEGERELILAEKVLAHPEDADEVYDLEVADDEYALLQSDGYPTYEDTSTATAGTGAEIWFLATPLYDDGELLGVVEFIQRQADSERRRREMDRLLSELQATLSAFEEGEFSARAEFDFAESIVNREETEVLSKINEMARMREALQQQIQETEAAKEELERQNEKLERFASMVSHDLRNPLNVALGHIDLAAETGDESHIDAVRNSLERMNEMVDELLTFARSGGSIEETETVSLPLLVREAWDNVAGGESELVCDVQDFHVDVNPDGMLNVFENLFRNAIDHNDDPVTITVEGETDVPEGKRILVSDDGTGLPPAVDDDEIFEYGYTTDDQGTGFGLAIVRDIVEAHGWEISARDRLEGGVEFAIETAP